MVTVQGGYGACFCNPGTNFIEHYACRGTSLIGAGKLSRYRIFVGALAQSGPGERSESGVAVQTISEPGNYHCVGFYLRAGARVWV